ncbi:hypothetical protein CSB11_02140 [Candidatus Campbellbacteria bacterium]|nr:MAG: hypothetical protein CSB11_02140 [Candidatus Campbellbacteria bacterium]
MKRKIINSIKRILKATILTIFVLSVLIFAFLKLNPAFGGKPTDESLTRIQNSENYNGKNFENKIPTNLSVKIKNKHPFAKVFKSIFFPPENKKPNSPLVSETLDGENFSNGDIAWLGHSTVIFRTNNMTVLTDPVFNNASPIPYTFKPFEVTNKTEIENLPEKIDVVLISHDHYDHLDYKAIKKLDYRTDKFLVGLGVKAHLLRWGVSETKIQEFDWYEETVINDTKFVFAPARHFSGRSIGDKNKTLWGSWIVKSENLSLYFSGDGGYSSEFKKIGEKFGPFDIAFLEDGAYNKNWPKTHMFPEESVKASVDLSAEVMVPIHWAKFDLSVHTWKEPIERTVKETRLKNINLATPKIGQIFTLKNIPKLNWWEI